MFREPSTTFPEFYIAPVPNSLKCVAGINNRTSTYLYRKKKVNKQTITFYLCFTLHVNFYGFKTVSEDKVSFTVTVVMMCFVTRRDDGMWNAGWNEVIWPNASFRPRPQETVQHCLFPLHHISFFPSLFHTKAHTHTQTQTINLVILPLRWKEGLTSGTSLESDNRLKVKELHIPEQSTW